MILKYVGNDVQNLNFLYVAHEIQAGVISWK